ncbi:hypothetical protein Tsubulata_022527 [Turnera subulata]|uniref:DUF4378 domain-containing protein n=1 Tax=Turnera subulata TaxID=218843 RepID=A0A9Q0FU68_9ROSI|nr:hypothetical protein Tsubulata_022527 [Turnera subulata]
MGGLMHFFDFGEDSMARKIFAHKRQVDGLEAPRNSMELQGENSKSCCTAGDRLLPLVSAQVTFIFKLQYPYQVEELSENYPIEASMKKLINEEISRKSNARKNTPSIVARLMGVDMLPLDSNSLAHPVNKTKEHLEGKFSKSADNEWISNPHCSTNSNSRRQMELDSVYYGKERYTDVWAEGQKMEKPRPREHPQEEELQKFKKEFEAWQAARFKECSKVVEIDDVPGQLLDQEKFRVQKMIPNATSDMPKVEKPAEEQVHASNFRSRVRSGLQHPRQKMELYPTEQKQTYSSSNKTANANFEHSFINCDQKLDKSLAPTRIVILKPGPDRIFDHEDSWTSSSGTFEDRGSIEDFLEEVKDRLKCEMQGKTHKKGSVARGSGIETPFSENPSDPKQIAQHIAKQVRDSVTRDFGMNLLRSESTRSYRSDFQFNGPGSPEFIHRDTRRFLSERLRNVLRRETHLHTSVLVCDGYESSLLENERVGISQACDTSNAGNEVSYWEIVKDESEMQTRSFRHGDDNSVLHREMSPRNLIRSLSAPVSGTSFGKLLLEDRHVLTGAHIRRKHESLGNVMLEAKKRKKEKFNIKEKVSNFRYHFTLRGRLFGRKIQSIAESRNCEQDLVKDIMSGPTVMNCGNRRIMENSTEVPPSPASVCSSAQEDFWRPVDCLSPVSTPDITFEEDNSMPRVFKEISSNLDELRRQLNQLASNELEDTGTEREEPIKSTMPDIEDHAEAYIRDLLVASGLYNGSSDKWLSRWEAFSKPISKSVFDEVEKSSTRTAKDNETTLQDENEKKVDHKMLFDLLNETLPAVLGPGVTASRFRKKIFGLSMLQPLCGRKLLDCVWEIIREYIYPMNDKSYYSLEYTVARNLESTPWSGLVDEVVSDLGKEMECLIIEDMIEEVVKDLQ